MKKLFTNDGFFAAVTLLAVIGIIVYMIPWNGFNSDYLIDSFSCLVIVVCLAVLYISYRKYEKNVMKGMMGALLMAIMLNAVSRLAFATMKRLAILYLVLSISIFVTHFLINKTHKASPIKIRLNQMFVILISIVTVVWDIKSMIYYGSSATAILIADIIGCVCLYLSIICVESRLDAYRLDREAAGWTEEAGYPEGYVHEYQKRK